MQRGYVHSTVKKSNTISFVRPFNVTRKKWFVKVSFKKASDSFEIRMEFQGFGGLMKVYCI